MPRWSPTSSKPRPRVFPGSRPIPWPGQPRRCMRRREFRLRAFEAAAAWPNYSTTSGIQGIRCSWLAVARRSRPRRLPCRRRRRRHRFCALLDRKHIVGPRGASQRRLDRDRHTAAAPMAQGADHRLLFEAAASPGFFPSLTGAIAMAVAGGGYVRAGRHGRKAAPRADRNSPGGDVPICFREGVSVMGIGHSRVLHRSLRETPPKAVGGEGVWLIAGGQRISMVRRRGRFLSRTSTSARDRGHLEAGVEARLCPYRLLLVGARRGARRATRRR